MSLDPGLLAGLDAALERRPDAVWVGDDVAYLGWGVGHRIDPGTGADRFDTALRQLRGSGAPLALASFTFDEDAPGSVAVVPRLLARIDSEGTTVVHGDPADLPPPAPRRRLPGVVSWQDEPDVWHASVGAALAAIARQEVEKVVLSRIISLVAAGPLPLPELVGRLVASEPDSHTFLVDGLIGSSPELLVSLVGGRVRSVSLAGSADPGDPRAGAVLEADKTIREHALAADSVEEALSPSCPGLTRSPVRVADYGGIRHLATTFTGTVLPGTTVADLLASLHPTAAVAGTPTKSALELIREIEPHDRGRYAGPVGWMDRDGNGEFAIALRCGLVDGNEVSLYAGAGLVAGSDARHELEETEMKLRPMLGALGVNPGSR